MRSPRIMTREQHRTKAMAMIGGSIGLMFALSLVAAPVLLPAHRHERPVCVIGVLSLAEDLGDVSVVPPEPAAVIGMRLARSPGGPRGGLAQSRAVRLNFGSFRFHVRARWPFSS